MIKAVIYDVDGTMVDSEPLHVDAWDKALQLHNHRLTDLSQKLQNIIAGRKPIVNAKDMVEELDIPVSPEIFLKEKTDLFMDLIKTNLQEMPSLKNSIERLKNDGYIFGIGTSQMKEYIDIVLDVLDVRNFFEVIVTGDEIKKGKPDPETYLVTAEKLGLKPEECVVIEDATSGIQSAKAAGCLCITITNPNAVKQDVTEADAVISSHDEITDELIKNINI